MFFFGKRHLGNGKWVCDVSGVLWPSGSRRFAQVCLATKWVQSHVGSNPASTIFGGIDLPPALLYPGLIPDWPGAILISEVPRVVHRLGWLE